MLDIQLLRSSLDAVTARLADRGYAFDRDTFLALEAERRQVQGRAQELQAARNAQAKKIGQAKAKGEDAAPLLAESAAINAELGSLEARSEEAQKRLRDFLSGTPNLPHESVPTGRSADDNVEVRRWGTPRTFDFEVRDHVDVGTALGQIDFDTASKLSGARFTVLKAGVARLHRVALILAAGDTALNHLSAQYLIANNGGATRAETVFNGLNYLLEQGAVPQDWVLVHDAARCLISPAQIDALIDACLADPVGGLLAHRLADTLKAEQDGRVAATVARADTWLAQTPQMFRIGPLRQALQAAGEQVTDESSAMEAMGWQPRLVPGSARNFKVTYPEDFALAEALLLSDTHRKAQV